MSSDLYIHAVRVNRPVLHEYLGGNGVKDDLHAALGDDEWHIQREMEPGWVLFEVSQEFVIESWRGWMHGT